MKYNKTEYFCMGLAAIVYYPIKLVASLAVCPISAVGKYAKEHDLISGIRKDLLG